MNFYEKFAALCSIKGKTITQACYDIGIDPSSATAWKKGSKPRATLKAKVAQYFEVPINYFDENDETPPEEFNKKAAANSLRVEQRALLELTNGMTAEQINLMVQLARGLRGAG